MKLALLNRKLFLLVATALLLGTFATTNYVQRELSVKEAQISNHSDVLMAVGPKNKEPKAGGGGARGG